jgi:hypothetical protein
VTELDEPAETICSARGCREPAAWAVRWNNPKLHPPERRKTWLACPLHREHLADFLAARGFLREIEPFGGPGDHGGSDDSSPTNSGRAS